MTIRPDPTFHATAKLAMEAGFKDMKYYLLNPPDYRPMVGSDDMDRPSRLGGMFPAW